MLLLELEVMSGTVAGKRIAVSPPGGMIGRDPVCSVFLPDRRVSGYHAELSCENEQWQLHDVGSTNGTYLDARPVGRLPTTLPPSGIIQVADVKLRFSEKIADAPPENDGIEVKLEGALLPTLMGYAGKKGRSESLGRTQDAVAPTNQTQESPNLLERQSGSAGSERLEGERDEGYEDASSLKELLKMARKGDLASLLDFDFDGNPDMPEQAPTISPGSLREKPPEQAGAGISPAQLPDSAGMGGQATGGPQTTEGQPVSTGGQATGGPETATGGQTAEGDRPAGLGLPSPGGPLGLPRTAELHLGLAEGRSAGQNAPMGEGGADARAHEKLQREHAALRARYVSLEEELARLQPALKGLRQENSAHLRALRTLNTALEEAQAAQKHSEQAAQTAAPSATAMPSAVVKDVFDRTLTYVQGFGEQLDALILVLSEGGDIQAAKTIAEELSLTLADLYSLLVYGRQQFPAKD